MPDATTSWSQAFRVYLKPAVIAMLFLGFSAGLPLLLVFSTLSAWLSDAGVSRTAIGFFGWVGITYSVKVLWAPVIDRLPVKWVTDGLGQRRGWILIGQLGVIAGLIGMASVEPLSGLTMVAVCAVLVAFAAATQDVAIDAFRIESAVREYQGAMSSTYILGYRLALLVAGAGSLYIAEFGSWPLAYLSMAALMAVGVVTVFLVPEPPRDTTAQTDVLESELHRRLHLRHRSDRMGRLEVWFVDAVIAPFVDFFRRNGRFALIVLLFIGLYRLSDIVMGIMANPFYLELGFSKSEIASIGKFYGFFMTVLGSFLGGLLVVRYGVFRPLLAGAMMVAATNLLFAKLSLVGPELPWLALVISADNLSGGFANAAFIAYLSGLTNRAYTATQYALFSSLMTLPGKFVSGFSGMVVDASSYTAFFSYAAVMGIPAILLAIVVMRRERDGN